MDIDFHINISLKEINSSFPTLYALNLLSASSAYAFSIFGSGISRLFINASITINFFTGLSFNGLSIIVLELSLYYSCYYRVDYLFVNPACKKNMCIFILRRYFIKEYLSINLEYNIFLLFLNLKEKFCHFKTVYWAIYTGRADT
ncbi:MAG: hypothetical protein V1874_07700 [Spirochaetota bacterium]